jgi:microcystin-dependent protein
MVWVIRLAERVASLNVTTPREGRVVDQYLGEIKLVGFNFAPIGWAECQGQIVSIQQYSALFALFGTMYGGNGTSNFGFPDLQGRAAGHVGPSLYTVQGMKLGTETVTVQLSQYPSHSHGFNVNTTAGTVSTPSNTTYLASTAHPSPPPPPPPSIYAPAQGAPLQPMNNTGNTPVIGVYAGGSQPHENMMPFLTVNYIVSLSGQYPSRG